MTTIDLAPLFSPRSIAVVGASPRGEIAQTVRANLLALGSTTPCHFVNPRYEELSGQRCYPSLASLPETPDLVVVALSAARTTAAVREAAEAGARAVIVPGGGVVEGGATAARMQREVAAIARKHAIALVGPNCMGVWDLTTNSAAYIGDVNPWLPRGGIAAIAQSGSVTDAFIHSGNRAGFSRIIGCGAEAVLDVCDYLAWCLDDPATTGVILFVEGFKRPERFLALADRALQLGKPIAALKVGRSEHAQAAAVAHTGSLAGEARATEAALDATGVIRCQDLDELLEVAELLEGCRRTGRAVGRGRTAVVTVSTGEASLIADLAPRTGLELPPLPDETRAAITARLPTLELVANPLDPWGADDPVVAYGAAFEALAASLAFDVLVLVHDFPYRSLPSEVDTALTVTRALLAATAARPGLLPVYVSLTSGEPTPEVKQVLDTDGGGVPLLRGAVPALAAVAGVTAWEHARAVRAADGPRRPGWPDLASDRTSWGFDPSPASSTPLVRALPERESLELARRAGLPTTRWAAAAAPDEAVVAAERLGYPVAVKVDADGMAHKSERGGVRLGLANAAAVRAAAADLLALELPPAAVHRGLLVQPMAPLGVELLLGARRDPQVGPIVLVGLGGVLAEALDDVVVHLAPLTHTEARRFSDRLRGARLFDGQRGLPAVDRDALADALVRLGDWMAEDATVQEIDLNPVIGGVAVDALVVGSS